MALHIKSISSPPERLYPWQKPAGGATTIGVIDPCYGSSHVIYGLNTQRYRHRTLSTVPLKRLDGAVTYHQFTPFVLDWSLPLIHTWNAVPLNRDFIVSFELELPRYLGGPSDAQVRRGFDILASHRCKKILALSNFAFRYARQRFEKYGMDTLSDKMEVFRGAVPDPLPPGAQIANRAIRPPFSEKPLSAIVVGMQLFQKGGMHAIRAFERLRVLGYNVQLTLIGAFEIDNCAFGEGTPDASEWDARARNHDWIRFTGPVPNAQVFDELLKHDMCIYTSLDESLGWLPIESAMLGVPVIGTRICAIPELVHHRVTGWLVGMPLREDGRWSGLELKGVAKLAALDDANERLVAGIEACLTTVYENPALLVQWGIAAREWAVSEYGMAGASQRLEQIYDGVLGIGA